MYYNWQQLVCVMGKHFLEKINVIKEIVQNFSNSIQNSHLKYYFSTIHLLKFACLLCVRWRLLKNKSNAYEMLTRSNYYLNKNAYLKLINLIDLMLVSENKKCPIIYHMFMKICLSVCLTVCLLNFYLLNLQKVLKVLNILYSTIYLTIVEYTTLFC
jgi:hypothetical protein